MWRPLCFRSLLQVASTLYLNAKEQFQCIYQAFSISIALLLIRSDYEALKENERKCLKGDISGV